VLQPRERNGRPVLCFDVLGDAAEDHVAALIPSLKALKKEIECSGNSVPVFVFDVAGQFTQTCAKLATGTTPISVVIKI